VRRWILIICVLAFLSACGRKTVRVAPPGATAGAAATEMQGLASYYAEPYHGRKTANGETFDTYNAMTAAHRTLPFNTVVRVTNKVNGKEVDVRINDRGPFIDGRVIDLSLIAARNIDMVRAGVVPVELTILKEGDNARVRSTTGVAYAVQVGAFSTSQAAETLREDLEKRYREVSVQSVDSDKAVYRVRVGRESSMQSAEKLADQLRKDDFKPFVVRVN
jgi:rare lipoprotein A